MCSEDVVVPLALHLHLRVGMMADVLLEQLVAAVAELVALDAFLQTPAYVGVTEEASCEDLETAFATSLSFQD